MSHEILLYCLYVFEQRSIGISIKLARSRCADCTSTELQYALLRGSKFLKVAVECD